MPVALVRPAATESGGAAGAGAAAGAREVRGRERRDVDGRRHARGLPPADGDEVGLALSGGGVRSGAVGLGVLQALHRTGTLRAFDYLCTVSGGGYAGAFLTSSAAAVVHGFREGGPDRASDGPAAAVPAAVAGGAGGRRPAAALDRRLDELLGADDGRLTPRMQRFVFGGHYLRKTWEFLNRQLIGVLLMWALIASGLTAAAAAVAWTFHALAAPETEALIYAVWPAGDLARVLFPAGVCLLVWLGLWTASYLKFESRATGRAARWAFYGLVAGSLGGVAVLIGMGDLHTGTVFESVGLRADSRAHEWAVSLLQWASVSLVGVGLLPFLRPSAVFRSGTDPAAGRRDRVIYWVSTRALVAGVPFLLVAAFAREDVAGSFAARDHFARPDVTDWGEGAWAPLWVRVKAEAAAAPPGSVGPPSPPATPSVAASRALWDLDVTIPAALAGRLASPSAREKSLAERAAAAAAPGVAVPEPQPGRALRVKLPAVLRLLGAVGRERVALDDELAGGWALWHGPAHLAARLVGRGGDDPVARYRRTRGLEFGLKEAVVAGLNGLLLDDPAARARFHRDVRAAAAGNAAAGDAAVLDALDAADAVAGALPRAAAAGVAAAAGAGPGAVADRADWGAPARTRVFEAERGLLAALYGDAIRPAGVVTNHVVRAADQRFRLRWLLGAALLFVAAALLLDLNATSWHGFYGERLGENWVEPVGAAGKAVPLWDLGGTAVGAPYPLISASLHLPGPRHKPRGDRSHDHFLFSPGYCGSEGTGYARTASYAGGSVRLDDAIALSGGAVTPLGTHNPLQMALMLAANVRLGQWVPNPGYVSPLPGRLAAWERAAGAWPITPFRIALNLFRRAEERPYLFVTDGGHTENLGVGPLLARRCRLIVAVDAGQDRGFEFRDLTKLVRWARVKEGVRIEPLHAGTTPVRAGTAPGGARGPHPLAALRPDERTGLSAKYLTLFRVRYPDRGVDGRGAAEGLLVYVKSTMTGAEPLELEYHRAANPDFPHNPTTEQFYEPERFESYRQLGSLMGGAVADLLGAGGLPADDDFYRTLVDHVEKAAQADAFGGDADDPVPGPSPRPARPARPAVAAKG